VAERALIGSWVMDEVRLAVQKGYQVIQVYEVYEYKFTQYNPQIGMGGLLVEYIDTFLKFKAQASGYPSWVRTPEDEDLYIQSFEESEGIRLDKDAIGHNPEKRALAKLCLNSMRGKLTERKNRVRTNVISEPRELYRFLTTPGFEVTNLIFANDDVVWASWRFIAKEKIPSLRHTNEVLGGICDVICEHKSVLLSGPIARESAVLRHRLCLLHTENGRVHADRIWGPIGRYH
jgi:hypothetical protein